MVGECKTCEEVTALKDEQLKKVLQNVKSSVKEWDTNKCPATKSVTSLLVFDHLYECFQSSHGENESFGER